MAMQHINIYAPSTAASLTSFVQLACIQGTHRRSIDRAFALIYVMHACACVINASFLEHNAATHGSDLSGYLASCSLEFIVAPFASDKQRTSFGCSG